MSEVARTRLGIATCLAPVGALTEQKAVAELGETLQECLASGEIHLVLDFARVSLIYSAALEMLIDTHDELARVGGELKITHANSTVRDVFLLTQAEQYIHLVDAQGGSS